MPSYASRRFIPLEVQGLSKCEPPGSPAPPLPRSRRRACRGDPRRRTPRSLRSPYDVDASGKEDPEVASDDDAMGIPTTTPTAAITVDCHAIEPVNWRFVNPKVLSSARSLRRPANGRVERQSKRSESADAKPVASTVESCALTGNSRFQQRRAKRHLLQAHWHQVFSLTSC